MTGKRYYAHKHLMKEDKVHDKICHRFMDITETVEHMNMYYQKYTALKKENEQLKQFKEYVFDLIDKEIKETKEIFEDGKIDLMIYNDAMIILTGLKEQLKGDV